MKYRDHIAVRNAAHWEEAVKHGTGHSIPWLDLDLDQLHRYIQGDLGEERLVGRREPRRFVNAKPEGLSVLGDVEGKDVLCLSCGGGQQSALFSLLGGHVTVVDLAQGQLAADREAATHYGYEVRTIHGDMRDLSCLDAESFGIVVGMTPCYVPSIREVYTEVARVLKIGGLYQTDVESSTKAIEWDEEGNRISQPYAEMELSGDYGGVHDFRHYIEDILNGLSDNGLRLLKVERDHRYVKPPPAGESGRYSHQSALIDGDFGGILAKKEKP